eukprot:5532343-Prymnesium_polylepis.1
MAASAALTPASRGPVAGGETNCLTPSHPPHTRHTPSHPVTPRRAPLRPVAPCHTPSHPVTPVATRH